MDLLIFIILIVAFALLLFEAWRGRSPGWLGLALFVLVAALGALPGRL